MLSVWLQPPVSLAGAQNQKPAQKVFLLPTEEMMALKRPLHPTGGWKILFALRHSTWGSNLALRRGDNDCVGAQTPRNDAGEMKTVRDGTSGRNEFPILMCVSERGKQITCYCDPFKICLRVQISTGGVNRGCCSSCNGQIVLKFHSSGRMKCFRTKITEDVFRWIPARLLLHHRWW